MVSSIIFAIFVQKRENSHASVLHFQGLRYNKPAYEQTEVVCEFEKCRQLF